MLKYDINIQQKLNKQQLFFLCMHLDTLASEQPTTTDTDALTCRSVSAKLTAVIQQSVSIGRKYVLSTLEKVTGIEQNCQSTGKKKSPVSFR